MAKRKSVESTLPNKEDIEKAIQQEIPPWFSSGLKHIEDKFKDRMKKEIHVALKDSDLIQDLLDNQSSHLSRFNQKTYEMFEKKMKKIVEDIEKITRKNEVIEEVLTNVLLAIRQNEYLQAWYPPHQGYPEMKVTGRHPLQVARREKEDVDRNSR